MTRTDEQTLAARFWAEPPVQQAHGSFRNLVLDHAAGHRGCVEVHGDDLRDLRRRAHRLLRRQVPLPVLASDHRHPGRGHRRQRGNGGRPNLVSATSRDARTTPSIRVRTRASPRPVGASSRDSSERETSISPSPASPGLGDRHFDKVKDLQYDVGNARIWGGIHYRSAIEDGVTIGTKTVNQVLAHHFHRTQH